MPTVEAGTLITWTALNSECANCGHLGWSHDNFRECAECDCEEFQTVEAGEST